MAVAVLGVLAGGVGASAATTKAASPALRLVVEPVHPAVHTTAEIVAQVTPASMGRGGTLTGQLVSPGGKRQAVSLTRVQGGTAGTWEGQAPVPATGGYELRLRYTNGGTVLTAAKAFTVTKGSPLGHTSLIIVVVVLGAVWFLMRRRAS